MLSADEIKRLIEDDAASPRKQYAKIARRYYGGDHDIKKYRIFFVDKDGKVQEDTTKSNARIARLFFRDLTDQGAQYFMSGKGKIVRSDDPELQKQMDLYFNNGAFRKQLSMMLKGKEIDGDAYAYAYKKKDGRTAFMYARSAGVVEVRKSETDDGCEYVIYWYVDRIGKDNKKIKRIQVWDDKQVAFFCQVDNGPIIPDESEKINPAPHSVYTKDGEEGAYAEDYGLIPFFRLDNNEERRSSLHCTKDHIDDYDIMNSGLTNNIKDAAEVVVLVRGYDGDDLDELIFNMRQKKQISTDLAENNVEFKTIDIPVDARVKKMEIDQHNIYHDGRGVDIEALKDSNATVSVGIKATYHGLDMRCEETKAAVEEFMEQLVQVALNEINRATESDYTLSDVYFEFERESIVNVLEKAQVELTQAQARQAEIMTLLSVETKLDHETLMQQICDRFEIDYEEVKDKLPKPEESGDPYSPAAAGGLLAAITPEDDQTAAGGEVIE